MSRLINTTTMTVDAVDRRRRVVHPEGWPCIVLPATSSTDAAGMVLGRKTYDGLAALLAAAGGASGPDDAQSAAEVRRLEDAAGYARVECHGDRGRRRRGHLSAEGRELDGDLFLIGCGELAALPARERPGRRAPLLAPSGRVGRGHAALPGREGRDAAARLDVVRLGRHAPAIRAARTAHDGDATRTRPSRLSSRRGCRTSSARGDRRPKPPARRSASWSG